ncbi:MAG: Metallothionein expression activator [Alectoria fallacina]|uniref:Metallothionein expression activator n=1 Tax=Alectoria fallacina TaxID=1903189 RepID=A0A8H3IJN1_9LECA|nr:MAG: Metallothionein expression activator [Alectoria fallacina]
MHRHQSLSNIQQAPCQEHGSGFFMDDQPNTQMTAWENSSNQRHSLQDAYNSDSIDIFQSFDSTTSAGYLDGFGTGHDQYTGNSPPNETTTTKDMPHGMPSQEDSQRPTTSRDGTQRPCTPTSQMRTSYFPITPATTPFSQNANTKKALQSRTAESSPTRRDPNLTIKASHAMQRGTSCQDNFATMRQNAMSPGIPSPPHTAPGKGRQRSSVDLAAFPQLKFMNMSNLKMDIPGSMGGYNASNYSPMSNAVSSAISSFQSSPEMAHMTLFEDINAGANGSLVATMLSALPSSRSADDLGVHPSPMNEEPHPRSQSMSENDPEDWIDTGVTCNEIASFIGWPENDNKWKCLYPHCEKKFGRKENIKSHVQTHLGDRHFQCKDCLKRFVRQHDLKRHANIHSGVKSYPCPCGKGFARHDALTRHRQRGMCIGAFEGTPKKVIKRGRPKKPRPDAEERLEKSAKTRQRVLEKRSLGEYASSASGSSASSYPSPEQFFDDMDFTASSPSHGHGSLQQISGDISGDLFSYTPPTSPSYSTGNCFSPQHSQHSHTPKAVSMSPSPKISGIPQEQYDFPNSHSGSRKSSTSYFGTPPELDLSSSSPAASKFFDFDGSSDVKSSQSIAVPLDDNLDFFKTDFDMSSTLSKEESMKGANMEFHDFFNAELEMTGFGGESVPDSRYGAAFDCNDPFATDFFGS